MEKKLKFPSELAYIFGILGVAAGAAFMTKADYGLSMVVAPAYLIHLKVSEYLPFFSFGMAEYAFQAVLIIALCFILRKAKISYLFSFVTAVVYGLTLDFLLSILPDLASDATILRLVFYFVGLVLCSIGVAFLFHTYIAPEAYELFVKEISGRFGWRIDKVKTVYDLCSLIAGVVMSFAFFGLWHFEGVKLGTLFCALVNGWLIGRIGAALEHFFEFKDALKLRKFFDK